MNRDPMHGRDAYSSGSEFEKIFGFSRAVRAGSWVAVSGCTAAGIDGGPIGGADVVAQTRECLRRVETALDAVGASLNAVVRTRFFVTDITAWPRIGLVHAEVFGDLKPATTIVEISRLALPELLVEVEADAVLSPLCSVSPS
jgi:enamine deaminase RidA (YjgF/YER057c/UK114 family)